MWATTQGNLPLKVEVWSILLGWLGLKIYVLAAELVGGPGLVIALHRMGCQGDKHRTCDENK